MSGRQQVPEPQSSASEQERSDRPLPAVIPPSPGEGLVGFELPEALRSAGEGGLRGTALVLAVKWVEQQTTEMSTLRDDIRRERTRNDQLVGELSVARQDNAVLRERLHTRWVTYATGVLGAVLLGWAPSVQGPAAIFVAVVGVLLLAVTLVDIARRR